MEKEINKAFKVQARARIPDWTEPITKYNKTIEWIRRQYWKNNKNKTLLTSSSGESTTGISRVTDSGLADTVLSAGEAGAGTGAGTGAGALGYWTNVL